MDSWKAFDVFLCFLLLSIKAVNPALVFTVIRGEQDRLTFDSGCENQDRYSILNTEKLFGNTTSCIYWCKWDYNTFLLSKGKCVKNDFVWSSSSMGYGKKDCKYFVGYDKDINKPLTVVKPSSTNVLTKNSQQHKNYQVRSIEYFTPDQKWMPFSTNNGVLTTKRIGKFSPLELNVSPNITKYPEILGRIVKVTLGNGSRNVCTLFKVAGQWTYRNLTGTSASLLNPSTTLQTSKTSRVYSSLPTFSSTAERKTLLFTSSLITTPQTSTRSLVVESSSVHITSSVAGTATPSGRSTIVIYPTGTETSTRQLVVYSSSVHTTSSVAGTRTLPSGRSTAAISPTGTDEPSTSSSKPPTSGKRSGSNIGAAVGGGVGAVILLVALILFIICVLRHRKRKTGRPKNFPALNNPGYVTENSFSLEKSNFEAKSDDTYMAPIDGKINKPYKSLVKKQPVNTGADDEDYTYASADGLPSGEPHYHGLVKQKIPNSTSVKSKSKEPLYNVLEGPNSTGENDAAPFYDVVEKADGNGSDSQNPPRYVQPSKQRKGSQQKGDKAPPAPAPLYDVLEGPDSDRSQGPLQTAFYDVLEGSIPTADSSFPQETSRALETNGRAHTGASQAPLYDVLEGPECNESTEKNNNRSGNQTYEALHPARESIYQPLKEDVDDYDNSYQSAPG